jgi:ubiquinone/menaquinone biosynthesis C-methylase UbiE
MARLLLQDRLINEAMKGLIPERTPEDLQKIHTLLDIGCGPGGWTLDVAKAYPHLHVTGIDNSNVMITHAQAEKDLHALHNIEFRVMDALQPLLFSNSTFDLVNIRNAVGYVPQHDWLKLLNECYRVTRPGGILRLTEGDGLGLTNSAAYEIHHRLGTRAMQVFGYGFSPDGSTLGITPMLSWLLKQAGFTEEPGMKSHFFDFSYGTSFYSSQIQNIALVLEAARPFILRSGVCKQAEIEALYLKALEEMQEKDFRGMGYFLTAWARKPLET